MELGAGRTVNLSPAGVYAILRKPVQLSARDQVIVVLSVPSRTRASFRSEELFTPARVSRVEDLGDELGVALQFQEETDVTWVSPGPGAEPSAGDGEHRRHERRPLMRALTLYRAGKELGAGRTVNVSPLGAYAIMRKPLSLAPRDAVIAAVTVPHGGGETFRLGEVLALARVCRIEDLGDEVAVALEFQEETDVT